MNGIEPIYNLILKILSMNEFNIIICWIDLKTNDFTDNSTIENTTNCIDNIAENTPIDRMNVQERYFEDNFSNFSPKKAPHHRPHERCHTIWTDSQVQGNGVEIPPRCQPA